MWSHLCRRTAVVAAALVSALLVSASMASGAEDRYPFRLPDWLWQAPPLVQMLDADDESDLRAQAQRIDELNAAGRNHEADIATNALAAAVGRKFAARDVLKASEIIEDRVSGRRLGVIIDPSIPVTMKPVLTAAVRRILRYATDLKVVSPAFKRSSERPGPIPAAYSDSDGKQSRNPAYQNFLQSVSRPRSAAAFRDQMTMALSPRNGIPAILVISSYSGNSWWGGSYYDFYYQSVTQLQRLTPQGFFYIRLNLDKMVQGQTRFDDPKLWASKIAHELLHNLGYWHPAYKDPADRDQAIREHGLPFIVGYEQAFLELP
jgi:hypothetical protein